MYAIIYIYVLGTDMLLQPASFPGVAKALRACAESKDEVLQTKVLQVCAAAAGSQCTCLSGTLLVQKYEY